MQSGATASVRDSHRIGNFPKPLTQGLAIPTLGSWQQPLSFLCCLRICTSGRVRGIARALLLAAPFAAGGLRLTDSLSTNILQECNHLQAIGCLGTALRCRFEGILAGPIFSFCQRTPPSVAECVHRCTRRQEQPYHLHAAETRSPMKQRVAVLVQPLREKVRRHADHVLNHLDVVLDGGIVEGIALHHQGVPPAVPLLQHGG
mmetsp:Transcript_78471/g.199588  ORF Transcript_78471/g.199588 Transcript_78471/m.199588 type:complete len:203 (-) Transcript_78471:47-655(-)